MGKVLEIIKSWSEEGMKLPLAYDGLKEKPSVTLLFSYFAFFLAFGITIYLTIKDPIAGSVGSLTLFFGCIVMYRVRHLDKLKIDLDDREIQIEDNTSSKEVTNNKGEK